MVERREVIGGGLSAGLSALFGGAAGAEPGQRNGTSSESEAAIARALDAMRSAFEHRHDSPDVDQIRAQQKAFLKANQKFPDFIDIGLDVWERLHDWHVRTGQPLEILRTSDGRYAIPFIGSTLVLQPQQAGGHISWGYDVR